MPHHSRWSVDIPITSLPSLILGGSFDALPATPAYVDTENPETLQLSWREYALWSKRVARGLLDAGLQSRDRVLVYSGNNVFFPVVFMGVVMAGGIISTANPAFVARELAYQIKDSGAHFLLIAEGSKDKVDEAARLAGLSHDRVFVFDDGPLLGQAQDAGLFRHWSRLIASVERGREFQWTECKTIKDARQTVAILYSSGTTGVPKGVELTHYGLVANCVQMDFLHSLADKQAHSQRLLAFLPMYHGLGLLTFSTLAPYRRVTSYIMKRFSLLPTMKNVERFRITELLLVPPILIAMAKNLEASPDQYDLSCVQRVGVGAAPLSREMCEDFEKLWPDGRLNVKQGWGMTELPISVLNWDEREISKTSAVGEPVPNCSVKIMSDDDATETPIGQPGELWCKAPQMMKGYWGRPEETRKTITPDGWLKTGDIAYADGNGKYVIIDRKKELIKVKGNQVAPAELEAVLLEHPEIQDAGVVGIKRDQDEVPLGYVVRRTGSRLSAPEILEFMAERTAKIKRLSGGIIFCNMIPKNPSGKILRRVLRERAAADVKAHNGSNARL